MDDRFDMGTAGGRSGATLAGVAVILVGFGAALVYLLAPGAKPRRPPRGGGPRTPTATIVIARDGTVTIDPRRLEVEIDPSDPHRRYRVRWIVENRTDKDTVAAFENFERDDDHVSPLDPTPSGRIRPVPARQSVPIVAWIAEGAVRDLIQSSDTEHAYEYDVWVDRRRRIDPEIAIIKV